MTYPYGLEKNPYPSSPTPGKDDICILGGQRHKDARNAIFSCINDIHSKMSIQQNNQFRMITMIQDVGSGKTHLALNIGISPEFIDKSIVSYLDLSQIFPRTIQNVFLGLIHGFPETYFTDLKRNLLYFIKSKYDTNKKEVTKTFKLGFFEKFGGKGIENKIADIMTNKMSIESKYLDTLFYNDFSESEIQFIKSILDDTINQTSINNFSNTETSNNTHQNNSDDHSSGLYENFNIQDVIHRFSILSKLNNMFYEKITMLQIDEFDSNDQSLAFIKAIINSHLPNTVVMLILTPSSYKEISGIDISVFDRLEKANYKIDLAGSNTFDEIMDIGLEYIRSHDEGKFNFKVSDAKALTSKLRIIFDEFQDFRNIRSMLNILYHSMEDANKRGINYLDEDAFDNTLRTIYPGLRIKGSLMNIPISEFIKIKNNIHNSVNIEYNLKDSILNLKNYVDRKKTERLADSDKTQLNDSKSYNNQKINFIYEENPSSYIVINMSNNQEVTMKKIEKLSDLNKSQDIKEEVMIFAQNIGKSDGIDDKIENDSDRNHGKIFDNIGTINVHIDRQKLIDLLYFNSKISVMDNFDVDDTNRMLLLGKSINLN